MRKARSHTQKTLFLLCIALGGLLCSGCRKKEASPAPAVEVEVSTVSSASITQEIGADAILAPVAQAAIAPKISSPVHKFFVQRGTKVHAGEILATLENKDLQAAREDNQGAYHSAQATYDTTTGAQIPEDYQKSELDMEQAQANLALNQKIVQARKELFTQGAIAGRDLDTAQSALVQAQAAYNAAKKHLDSMKAIAHEAAIKGAKGQLESAEGKLHGASAQLSYSQIRSPIDGIVTDRPLYEGETAAAGQTLLTVMDTSSMLAKVHLPQPQAQSLKPGAEASIRVSGIDDPINGAISLISPALDPGSTTVEVWIKIENRDNRLKAGTPVHVSIQSKTIANALLVPKAAVIKDSNGAAFLFVVGKDGTAHKTAVQAGIEDDKQLQITSGVGVGQQIVSSGAYALEDGAKVAVATEETKGPKKSGAAAGEEK